jgi:phosphomannomutase/phosphoglucomutase
VDRIDKIFKEYDIRGIYGEELTDEIAIAIGKAFGTYIKLKGEAKAIVGMDNRKSSSKLLDCITEGLCSTGIDVINIGMVITPIFYYSTIYYNINAGIMVTASHNPAQYNGFKIQYMGRTLYGAELQEIKKIAINKEFAKGNGSCKNQSISEFYINMITEKIRLGGRKLKVAIDAGNGTAGLFILPILERLGCEAIPIYCDSNPDFPNHFPDPTRVENMQDLFKCVKERQADVGLGFDGDGDRLGVIDDKGKIIWGDKLMVLFWREILPKYPKSDAIVEVKCSDVLVEEIKRLGGKPFFYKTGHSLIKAKMKELNAVFTGEMSGHMFFADEYFGYDDAIYAAGRLLRILSNTDSALHELLADLPKSYASPEIRVPCPEQEKASYVEKARKELSHITSDIVDVDGVRARFEDGWGLVRASNTGPELIVRYEGKSAEAISRIRKAIERSLHPLKIE